MRRLLLLLCLSASTAIAQPFPAKPVRWIVPFPPGGATDIIARIVAQKMSEAWAQPVIVENRAGAAGAIGSDAVAKSAPDGYTILMGTTSTHAVGPAINPKLPYNTLTDFTPVSVDLAVTIAPEPDLLPERVRADVAAALSAVRNPDGSYGLFAFERLDFGL